MLPVLIVKEEVLPDLFGEEETPPVPDGKTLARAARVCKTFSGTGKDAGKITFPRAIKRSDLLFVFFKRGTVVTCRLLYGFKILFERFVRFNTRITVDMISELQIG